MFTPTRKSAVLISLAICFLLALAPVALGKKRTSKAKKKKSVKRVLVVVPRVQVLDANLASGPVVGDFNAAPTQPIAPVAAPGPVQTVTNPTSPAPAKTNSGVNTSNISSNPKSNRPSAPILTLGPPPPVIFLPPGLGDVKISEFRYNGPNGALDEYVEIYNNTGASITVGDNDVAPSATPGWAIVSADAPTTIKCLIPEGTSIPARGHVLCTNSGGYSLGQYASGNTGASATLATGDFTYTSDIPINRGIALFRSTNSGLFLASEKLDAVGPASESNALFKEGTGLPDISAIASDYAWARRLPGGCTGTQPGFLNHNCTSAALIASTPGSTSGQVQDSDNNVTDFIFVDINGTATPVGNQRLGAPGPENLTSPIVRGNPNGSGTINPSLIDPQQASSAPPNRVRDLTSGTNANFGTIDIRKKFTNNTGASITRLRFRIMDISTFPALDDVGTTNDAADLRAMSSLAVTVTITGGSNIPVQGTTLEEDTTANSGQPVGGAFNSTLSAGTVTLNTPLANGSSAHLRFVFGVTQNGKFRVFVIVEALP